MTKRGQFLSYCVETYKNAENLTGRQVAELFTRYDVWDYVYSSGGLHKLWDRLAIFCI